MPDEEPGSVFFCDLRDARVAAQIGVERLRGRAEGVEEIQRQLAIAALVVPFRRTWTGMGTRRASSMITRGT